MKKTAHGGFQPQLFIIHFSCFTFIAPIGAINCNLSTEKVTPKDVTLILFRQILLKILNSHPIAIESKSCYGLYSRQGDEGVLSELLP